jgi:hypothetical protein
VQLREGRARVGQWPSASLCGNGRWGGVVGEGCSSAAGCAGERGGQVLQNGEEGGRKWEEEQMVASPGR